MANASFQCMHILCKKKDFIISPAISENSCSTIYVLHSAVQSLENVTNRCSQHSGFLKCNLLIAFVQQESLNFQLTLETVSWNHLVHHFAQTMVKFNVLSCYSFLLYLLCKSPAVSAYVSPSKQGEYLKTGFPMAIARLSILWSLCHFNCVTFQFMSLKSSLDHTKRQKTRNKANYEYWQ